MVPLGDPLSAMWVTVLQNVGEALNQQQKKWCCVSSGQDMWTWESSGEKGEWLPSLSRVEHHSEYSPAFFAALISWFIGLDSKETVLL